MSMSQYVQATSAAGHTVLCGATSYAEYTLHAAKDPVAGSKV